MSNDSVNIGGSQIRVDIRVGFLGLCFGPAPVRCTSNSAIFQPNRPSQLAASIPPDRGGGNLALAALALNLQSSLVVLGGLPLLLLLAASLLANAAQLVVSARGLGEPHAKAALWARSLDWAAAAGAATGFAAYRSVVAAASGLIRAVAGVRLTVEAGTTASDLFAVVVGTTLAGALINTFLTAMDAGLDAFLAGRKRIEGGGAGVGRGPGGGGPQGGMDGLGMAASRKRAAYEVFP